MKGEWSIIGPCWAKSARLSSCVARHAPGFISASSEQLQGATATQVKYSS